MKTAVQSTSIACYHAHVPNFEQPQESRLLAFIVQNGESTIGEMAHALGMEKSTVSARQNALREAGYLIFGLPRKCRVSGVTCKPLRLPATQPDLFQ